MGTKNPEVARWYATAKHEGQMYGNQPYTYHLEQAVQELRDHVLILPVLRFHDHDVIESATWLHDVVEDTGTQAAELDKLFCGQVVEIVQAVSDGPGRNRAERKSLVYQHICDVGPAALAVKLGDRLANAKTCGLSKEPSSMLNLYRKEQDKFEDRLRAVHGFGTVFQTIRQYLGM